MRQAIIWTNDGKFTDAFMCHSASMSKVDYTHKACSWHKTPQEKLEGKPETLRHLLLQIFLWHNGNMRSPQFKG